MDAPLGRIGLVSGDIVMLEADAVVNATTTMLLGGKGVDEAIRRPDSPLLEECRALKGRSTGHAKPTGGLAEAPFA